MKHKVQTNLQRSDQQNCFIIRIDLMNLTMQHVMYSSYPSDVLCEKIGSWLCVQ